MVHVITPGEKENKIHTVKCSQQNGIKEGKIQIPQIGENGN